MEKLQSKYECISSKSKGTDDGGEPKSQAYYVIKAAQAREAGKRDDEWSRGEIRSSWLQRNALSLCACEMIWCRTSSSLMMISDSLVISPLLVYPATLPSPNPSPTGARGAPARGGLAGCQDPQGGEGGDGVGADPSAAHERQWALWVDVQEGRQHCFGRREGGAEVRGVEDGMFDGIIEGGEEDGPRNTSLFFTRREYQSMSYSGPCYKKYQSKLQSLGRSWIRHMTSSNSSGKRRRRS